MTIRSFVVALQLASLQMPTTLLESTTVNDNNAEAELEKLTKEIAELKHFLATSKTKARLFASFGSIASCVGALCSGLNAL